MEKTLLLVPVFPLVGALLTYIIAGKDERHHRLAGWIATFAAGGAFVLTIQLFRALGSVEGSVIAAHGWTWFEVLPFKVEFAFLFDRLSAVMTLIVTGVGSLIHLYAIGYMEHDPDRPRFFAYLNLFLFAMLLLVLGDNLLVMFVGWEGVGLCSYLLIGFWHRDMGNAEAGQKAFVVNRIGDAGFLLGMFMLVMLTGSLEFQQLSQQIPYIDPLLIEITAILLFIGAVGKSAQIPLYVWLPDAMAGPTPVSALIHAATMVTAGVYMMARMQVLYSYAPAALSVVLVIGTLTAFVAATIAIVQNDIKKVLAYSTVSQLGYMFMAMGSAAFSNGIFHVVTHAFFKACLFMGAGSVIHGCHHEQDMRKFGGLWKKMPLTFVTYLISTLAIAGFPYLSGFFSKDAILWTVFSVGEGSPAANHKIILFGDLPLNLLCWSIGAFTALLTAFYMTRSLMLTFFGSYRGHHEPHESPLVMTLPLIILAALAAGFGYVYGEEFLHYLVGWTRLDMQGGHEALAHSPVYHTLELFSMGIAVLGIVLGVLCYTVLSGIPKALSKHAPSLHRFLSNKWWVDEAYQSVVVRPLGRSAQFLFKAVDRMLIDGILVNGSGMFVEAGGDVLRRIQTGRTSAYAFAMFVGLFVLMLLYLVFVPVPM